MPPLEFAADLPQDYVPGEVVRIPGPHGPLTVQPPDDAKPGETVRFRLAPDPEFRITVPPDAGEGTEVKFQREDGVSVSVPVPPGLKPGDTFEVQPPVLMVRVPEGAKPGDKLIFRRDDIQDEASAWLRCEAPEGIGPGEYFAARIPTPAPLKKLAEI